MRISAVRPDLFLDGTDNFATRFVMNDLCPPGKACRSSMAARWAPAARRW